MTEKRLSLPEDRIYLRFLLRWIRTAEMKIWENNPPVPVSGEGRLHASFILYGRLCELAEKMLEALWKDRLIKKNPLARLDLRLACAEERSQAAAELLQALEETDGRLLSEAAPLLSDQLDACAERFCGVFREMLGRIGADREKICRSFFYGEDFGEITGWSAQMADIHFHGRSTLRVDTEKGSFYYKPRDCRTDVLFGQVVEQWFSDITRVPGCLLRPGYAFCQNMVPSPASTEEEAECYFRNLGGLCALFQMLGASDLHSENLVAQGVYPVLVDMETILTPQPEIFSDPKSFPAPPAEKEDFIHDLNASLFQSSILPKLAGGKQISILLDVDKKLHQLPVVDGRKRTVLEFEDAFLEGFSRIYDRCVMHREELLAALRDFERIPVRRLLRHSAYYGRLLKALQRPEALASEEARRRITGRLKSYFQKHGAERLFCIARAEEASLLEGDIPCFYAMGGERDLLADGKLVCRGFFRESGVENAVLRLQRAGETEKAFEMCILRRSLAAALIPLEEEGPGSAGTAGKNGPGGEKTMEADGTEHGGGKRGGSLCRADAVAQAEDIFLCVRDFSLRAPCGQVSWLMRCGEGDSFGPAYPVLFQGTAGLGSFFAAVAAVSENGGIKEQAGKLAEICLGQIETAVCTAGRARRLSQEFFPLGLADGYAGVLLSLVLMGRFLKEPRIIQTAQEVLQLLEKVSMETVSQSDVISGTAGLLLVLCRFEELYETPVGKRCIRSWADWLLAQKTLEQKEGPPLWDTMNLGRPVSGMGHGMAGIAAALFRAYLRLGREAYRAAAQDALDFEYEIYEPSLGTWPDLRKSARPGMAMHGYCSGAPGVGLAMLVCLEGGGKTGSGEWRRKAEENLERAAADCLRPQLLFRDHLCCGNSAAVDFLLEAGRRLDRPELKEAAEGLLARMKVRRTKRGNYTFTPPSFMQAFDPSLFYGVSGVGYEMLRLADPERIESLLV